MTKEEFLQLENQNSTVISKIKETPRYDWFDFIDGNRKTNSYHVEKLRESIRTTGHIKTRPVLCFLDIEDNVKPLKIIDGQHSFEACKLENIQVPYVIDDSITNKARALEITIKLNNTSNEWETNDYLHSFDKQNNENYSKYKMVYDSNRDNFEHDSIHHILNNMPNYNNRINLKKFKLGSLQFGNSEKLYLERRLKLIKKIISTEIIYNKNTNKKTKLPKLQKRYYSKALDNLLKIPKFDIVHLNNKLDIYTEPRLPICDDVEGAMINLGKIYNYKRGRSKKYIDIQTNMLGKTTITCFD